MYSGLERGAWFSSASPHWTCGAAGNPKALRDVLDLGWKQNEMNLRASISSLLRGCSDSAELPTDNPKSLQLLSGSRAAVRGTIAARTSLVQRLHRSTPRGGHRARGHRPPPHPLPFPSRSSSSPHAPPLLPPGAQTLGVWGRAGTTPAPLLPPLTFKPCC